MLKTWIVDLWYTSDAWIYERNPLCTACFEVKSITFYSVFCNDKCLFTYQTIQQSFWGCLKTNKTKKIFHVWCSFTRSLVLIENKSKIKKKVSLMLICLVQINITSLKLKLWCHKILPFKSDLGWAKTNCRFTQKNRLSLDWRGAWNCKVKMIIQKGVSHLFLNSRRPRRGVHPSPQGALLEGNLVNGGQRHWGLFIPVSLQFFNVLKSAECVVC